MLSRIYVENVALIEKLELELCPGLNILTGETGAGKSIIIDAVTLALGGRADRELIRSGQERAVVTAFFSLDKSSAVNAVLESMGIECEDGELMISRELSADGRNTCRINGRAVSLSMLREIAGSLVDIYGQHEHQSLLSSDNHLAFLDNYAQKDIENAKDDTAGKYRKWEEAKARLTSRFASDEQRNREIELLQYQINEIEKANIIIDEEESLKNERAVLLNAEKIRDALDKASARLFKGSEVSKPADELIRKSASYLESISEYAQEYEQLKEQLNDIYYSLEDISSQISDALYSINADPQRLDAVEERLDELRGLKRKYGSTLEEVLQYCEKCKADLDNIINSALEYENNVKREKEARGELWASCKALSSERRKASLRFAEELTAQLNDLGMKNVRFETQFSEEPSPEEAVFTPEGFDKLQFLFSANLGQDLKPLSKIISGGELSRFMLAVKSITAAIDDIPTMVFDEIDSGISGSMASVVAKKIAKISAVRQVICITHLPQIAAMADEHYLINKWVENGITRTGLFKLNYDKKKEEIARLSGGSASSLHSLEHADEILKESFTYKAKIKNKN